MTSRAAIGQADVARGGQEGQQVPAPCRRGGVDILAVDQNPAGRAFDPRQRTKQAGLAAAIGPDQRDQFPRPDIDVGRRKPAVESDFAGDQ